MDRADVGYQHFFCTKCGVQLRAKASQASRQRPCPKCGTVLVVPPSVVSPSVVPPSVVSPAAGDTYAIREMPDEGHAGEDYAGAGHAGLGHTAGGYVRTGRRLERVPSARPKLPRWPLVQGVFSFLLTPGAIVCWSMLSFMGTLLFSLLLAAFALGQIATAATWLGSMAFLTISFFLGLLFALINAIFCLTILQESAAGNHVIEEWPNLTTLEYLGEVFILINSMLVTVVAALLVTYPLAGLGLLKAFSEVVCIVILFPVVLLSMLEAGSCLAPISLSVLQTICRSWRSWLVFYAESFVLTFGLLGYIALLSVVPPLLDDICQPKILTLLDILILMLFYAMVFVIVFGVPMALAEMIYFRLIGRLAWVCDEDSRRELAEEEAAEEEAERHGKAAEIRPTPVDDF